MQPREGKSRLLVTKNNKYPNQGVELNDDPEDRPA
jgi:hypothetical protein